MFANNRVKKQQNEMVDSHPLFDFVELAFEVDRDKYGYFQRDGKEDILLLDNASLAALAQTSHEMHDKIAPILQRRRIDDERKALLQQLCKACGDPDNLDLLNRQPERCLSIVLCDLQTQIAKHGKANPLYLEIATAFLTQHAIDLDWQDDKGVSLKARILGKNEYYSAWLLTFCMPPIKALQTIESVKMQLPASDRAHEVVSAKRLRVECTLKAISNSVVVCLMLGLVSGVVLGCVALLIGEFFLPGFVAGLIIAAVGIIASKLCTDMLSDAPMMNRAIDKHSDQGFHYWSTYDNFCTFMPTTRARLGACARAIKQVCHALVGKVKKLFSMIKNGCGLSSRHSCHTQVADPVSNSTGSIIQVMHSSVEQGEPAIGNAIAKTVHTKPSPVSYFWADGKNAERGSLSIPQPVKALRVLI